MRHVSPRPASLVLEEAAHHETGAWIVVLPAVHWVAKALEFAFFETQSRFEVISILFRHFIHVTKAREAVVPRDLACVVKD